MPVAFWINSDKLLVLQDEKKLKTLRDVSIFQTSSLKNEKC